MTVRCTLAGIPLSLRAGDQHEFPLRAGVNPTQVIFQMTSSRANAILDAAKSSFPARSRPTYSHAGEAPPIGPLTFAISSGGRTAEVKGLYVVAVMPGDSPNTLGLMVADRRWLWRRVFIERSYNVPIKSGEWRIVSGKMVPLQIAKMSPDRVYRKNSLKNLERPWKAFEVCEDILDALCGAGNYDVSSFDLNTVVQGVHIRDQGTSAAHRVRSLLPGLDFVPLPDGRIKALNTIDRSEIAVAQAVDKRGHWGPWWKDVDYRWARPARVHAHFEREIEMRFDYNAGSSPTYTPGREEPRLEMIIVNPVPELELTSGRTVAYGSLVEFELWLASIAALKDWPMVKKGAKGTEPLGALTDERIRRWYLSGMSHLFHSYALSENAGTIDIKWAKRIGRIQQDWRRTFQISPKWREKIRQIRPTRVALLDEENAVRAKAMAYFDHTIKPSFRSIAVGTASKIGWEIDGYAADLSDMGPSPAEVTILDQDSKVIRVTPRVDVFGVGVAIAPGHVSGEIPVASAGDILAAWGQVSLDSDWALAVIMSIIPDAPNDEGRLHRETVGGPAVAEIAYPTLTKGLATGSDGPTWSVFAGETTARFGWIDSRAEEIKNSVWTGGQISRDLMVNPKEVNGAALAHAARIYALLSNRGQGQLTISLDGSITPTGNLKEVTHGVRFDGRKAVAYTRLVMPPPSVRPSVWSVMPESARRILMRMVQE